MNFWRGFHKQAALKKDVELQPHQERVLRRLERSPGVLAYHGLGSGKTLTSIAATSGSPTHVVVPASLRENYKKELRKFTTHHKSDVMSYEGFLKQDKPAENLVIDEAHFAGRVDSQRAKELMDKSPEYQKRVLLTGTPLRNHPSELAPLLRMLRGDKEAPVDKKTFSDQFVQEVTHRPGFFGKLLGRTPSTTYTIKNPDRFRNLVRGYVDYHAGSTDDFPRVTSEIVKVPLSDDQKKFYKYVTGKMNPAMRYKMRKGLPPSKTEAKQLNAFLGAVRQISNTSRGFGGEGESKIDAAVSEIKNREAKDPNFKAVVYSNYLDSGIKAVSDKLKQEGISHETFTGSINDKERKRIVDDYNSGKVKALLLSGAGAQGLDLKGTKLVQLLEPHWNSSRLDQAKGRAIRYKSHSHLPEKERQVHVQRFHSVLEPGTIDKLLKKKDMSADEYLDMLSKDKDDLNNQFLDILKEEGAIER